MWPALVHLAIAQVDPVADAIARALERHGEGPLNKWIVGVGVVIYAADRLWVRWRVWKANERPKNDATLGSHMDLRNRVNDVDRRVQSVSESVGRVAGANERLADHVANGMAEIKAELRSVREACQRIEGKVG
jgi:hypothetical protein